MRGLLSLALMAVAALALAACGGVGQPEQASSGDGGGGNKKVCMMPKLVGIPYFNASEEGAKEAAEELGVELVYDGPTEALAADQVELIEQFTQQQCGAIAVSANDPDALAPAMQRAKQSGIATLTWDADVASEGRQVFINQATFQAIGESMVDAMARQTDERGEFLVVTGSLTAPNQNAWIDAMRAHMKENYPDMSIAAIEPGEEDLQRGIDITTDYLRANPDTAGVFGITSVALPGAAEAVQQAGLAGEVAVTGLSTPNDVKPYVESNVIEEFVLWSPADLGYLTVFAANAAIQGNLPTSGTFEAGRLGKVKVIAEDEILLGPPLVFNEKNIDNYDF